MSASYLVLSLLALLYLGLLAVAGSKFAKLSWLSSSSSSSLKDMWKTLTTQQVLFFIMSLACAARVAFFVCALCFWSSFATHVEDEITLYYVLESVSSILVMSVFLILVLFLMEIYFVSTHSNDFYQSFAKHLMILFMLLFGLALFFLSFFLSASSSLFYPPLLALSLAAGSILIILLLLSFGGQIVHLFSSLSISVESRKKRINNITQTAFLCVLCLLAKTFLLFFVLYDTSVTITTSVSWWLVFLFFFLLEWIPLTTVLRFFRNTALPQHYTSKDTLFGEEGAEGRRTERYEQEDIQREEEAVSLLLHT